MRSVVLVCLLAAVAAAGKLDDATGDDLLEHIRGTDAGKRREAATELAARLTDTSPDLERRRLIHDAAQDIAAIAVLTDDPVVRARLVPVLVAAGVVTTDAAARIPRLTILDRQLKSLLAEQRPDLGGVLPDARSCRIRDADPRGLNLVCRTTGCRTCPPGAAPAIRHGASTLPVVRVATRWEQQAEPACLCR